LVFLVAGFTMQLFFFLSGFFSLSIIQKKGMMVFAKSRYQRVVLPLILAIIVVLPVLQVVGLYGTFQKAEGNGSSSFQHSITYYINNVKFSELNLGHLWFLLYLTIISVGLLLVVKLVKSKKLIYLSDQLMKTVLRSYARPLFLALPTMVLMYPMNWLIDTPSRILPEWHIVAYYSLFFFTGALAARQKDMFAVPQKHWRLYLALAIFIVLPLTIWFLMMSAYSVNMQQSPYYLAATASCALFTWLMIFGMIGWFQQRIKNTNRFFSFLTEASFWIYLIHFPVVLFFQIIVMNWAAPVAFKFSLVIFLSFLVLTGSYRYLVKFTMLEAFLNGKKSLKEKAVTNFSS
jgi:peptidoglycan/LPS O-acetylase OafA/YrhL